MIEISSISGISKTSLWESWKEVRSHLKRAPRRDVLDYLEYDIDPDVWIGRLLRRIGEGTYMPEKPERYALAKSKGFKRVITVPSVPDLVLYRTIVDSLFLKARKKQKKHVYFCQKTLSKVVFEAGIEAREKIKGYNEGDYDSRNEGMFLEWMKYDQYRKLLIFDKLYPYIVVTDITNFFDSVLYGRIEESLHDLKVPSRMVSLLFNLLESLSIRERFTPVQRIGLPVDPCDCSRNLAHMALFPHDDRMCKIVGEEAYVRWMDDQNFGVTSLSEGLKVLSAVDSSLRRLHLTPNSGKSQILSFKEARVHFHFSANQDLDEIEQLPFKTEKERVVLRKRLKQAWEDAKKHEDKGEWPKILKRFYRYAGRSRSKMFVSRAAKDLKRHPSLVDRVADYMRYVNDVEGYIDFVEDQLKDDEQVYEDVSYQLIESLLKLEPEKIEKKRLRELGQSIHSQSLKFCGSEECRVLVPLLYLRFGDKRNIKGLSGNLGRKLDTHSPEITRAICAVLASCGDEEFKVVQGAASRLLRNHLSEFVKMVARIKDFKKVEGRFKVRIDVSSDSITGAKFIDMRAIVAARILGLCSNPEVRAWLTSKKNAILKMELSCFDKDVVRRLWPC